MTSSQEMAVLIELLLKLLLNSRTRIFQLCAEKSIEKFQVGHIWSPFSDEDGLPMYYGHIVKFTLTKVCQSEFGKCLYIVDY